VATFDLNILPIHRFNGQELADLPGLQAFAPPRKAARGREKDNLIVYLMLSGNAAFSPNELERLVGDSAGKFYQSPGSLTSAMRKCAEHINSTLLERNLSTTGRGQYALGVLALVSIREEKSTILLSGPAHAVWTGENGSRHIYDPALSGKGLGSSQNIQSYFSQVDLHSNDLLVLCGIFPRDWEADLVNERPPATLDASYRKLTFTKGDLNAALIQVQGGHGMITMLRPDVGASRHPTPTVVPATEEPVQPESFAPQADQQPHRDILSALPHPTPQQTEVEPEPPAVSEEEIDAMADFAAHYVQPSAYAIPPHPEETFAPPGEEAKASAPVPSTPRTFPPSIPRAKPVEPKIEEQRQPEIKVEEDDMQGETEVDSAEAKSDKPGAHAEAARQMAKVMANGIRFGRRLNERVGGFLRRFLPRLFPTTDSTQPLEIPTYIMVSMAVIVPVLVVTAAIVVYLRFGQSVQFDEYYLQALNERATAVGETDPVRQRTAWNNVLLRLDQAESYRETNESRALRSEAQSNYDNLMGIIRLEFVPAFTNGLGGTTQISRMAASESDLYMLNAEGGNILHATFTGRSLELDNTFDCKPGTYGGYQVGTIVDILALPKVNAVGATVLGIDTNGRLLYCSPGQVPQAFPLTLPNTNWERITAFTLDNGRLYVLDADARAIWVYVGKNSAFLDPPYFYFGNQVPELEDAIDLGVSGDDLYLLHADGRLSTCTFSRIAEVPTRCVDPAPYLDTIPAHQDLDIFTQANFTQMVLTNPPNPVVLLLDSENRSVFRFTPRSLELQNQISGYAGKANPFQQGPVGALAVSPNYVLYLAIGDQVYFATNLP